MTIPKGAAMGRTNGISAIILASFLLSAGGCAAVSTGGAPSTLPHYDRIVAIGDVHGSYTGVVSIMREAALIDTDNRWIGGNALLVQTGDLLDRGPDVRQVLDLFMSLQPQAEAAGGKVVVLMGNHEAMNLFGSMLYVNPTAYESFAGPGSEEKLAHAFERWQALFGTGDTPLGEDSAAREQNWLAEHPPGFVEYTEAMGPEGHYGKWLRGLPTLFRYGGTVFIHAGIGPSYADMPQAEIDQGVAANIRTFDKHKSYAMKLGLVEQWFTMSEMMAVTDSIVVFAETQELPDSLRGELPRLKEIKTFFDGVYETSPLMVDEGPLWFRGFADWPDDQLVPYLPDWLGKNNVWRMVVSHTPQAEGKIQSRLDGNIFLIDTGMLSEYFQGGRASALEIRDDDATAIYEGGVREPFPPPKIDYGPGLSWTGPNGLPLPFDTLDDVAAFLLAADPVSSKIIDDGVNNPLKVRLEKDGVTINAIFRHESESADLNYLDVDVTTEPRHFIDSYLGEIAAYEINRLLGLYNMPPTVYRSLNGMRGTLQLWAEGTMLDRHRAQENMLPPGAQAWNRQMADMRVFDNLINNIDRNQTNILIDPNWRLILIDHTRAFARDASLPKPEQVTRCSRGLWHSLRHLNEAEVKTRLSPYLSEAEINALFARRDNLVQLIRDLIDRKGEANVLF